MGGHSRTQSPAFFERNQDARSLLSGYHARGPGSMMHGGGHMGMPMPTPGYGDMNAGRAMSVHSFGGQGMMGRTDSPGRGGSPFGMAMNTGPMGPGSMMMGGPSNFMGDAGGYGSRRESGMNLISPGTGVPSDHQIIADIRSGELTLCSCLQRPVLLMESLFLIGDVVSACTCRS